MESAIAWRSVTRVCKQPFARRIVIAFVLMTALVSGVFSLSIVVIVQLIEARLVSEELRRELDTVLHDDLKQDRLPRLHSSTRFYASDRPEYAIPAQYARLEEGFTEVLGGDNAFYAYTQEINGKRYLLVQEQHEFEAREQVLFNVVLAGFIFAVLGAWGLGWVMARKVMAPVSRLAQQVRHRNIRMTKWASWLPPSTVRWANCVTRWSVNACLPAMSAMSCALH